MSDKILITTKNTNFDCKDKYKVTDFSKVVGTHVSKPCIRKEQFQEYLDKGYTIDMDSKNAFGLYRATLEVPEYETYTVQYLNQVRDEHKHLIKK